MRAVNRTRNAVLVEQVQVAANPWSRMRGLLGHRPLHPGEGMLLRGEKAIHTVGMTFAIDVLFIDRAGRVVHMIPGMIPFRASPYISTANSVLEMPIETIAQSATILGDQIEFEDM